MKHQPAAQNSQSSAPPGPLSEPGGDGTSPPSSPATSQRRPSCGWDADAMESEAEADDSLAAGSPSDNRLESSSTPVIDGDAVKVATTTASLVSSQWLPRPSPTAVSSSCAAFDAAVATVSAAGATCATTAVSVSSAGNAESATVVEPAPTGDSHIRVLTPSEIMRTLPSLTGGCVGSTGTGAAAVEGGGSVGAGSSSGSQSNPCSDCSPLVRTTTQFQPFQLLQSARSFTSLS